MNMLETKGLCKFYGGLKAVNDINFSVDKGEIVGIIGPNGAGKTTFFNVCTGSEAPTHGTVIFNGQDISGLAPEIIASYGMARTFQNIKLFKNMTVLDNVKIGFHMQLKTTVFDALARNKRHKHDEQLCAEQGMEILRTVGLSGVSATQAGNLSYGTQRKVEIARTLAMGPQIILLDEPAAGMNPHETMELLDFVQKLNQEGGYTVVVIEHDMKFIMQLCHRIMVMQYGKKLFEGSPQQVKDEPAVITAYLGSSLAK